MSWATTEFQNLFQVPSRNGIYKSKEYHGSGAKVINMGELFAYDRVGPQEMSRVQMSDQELIKSGVESGDLLFGRRSLVEAGAGRCALAWDINEPTTFESSVIRVRLDESVADPLFYFYYFRSPHGGSLIRSIVSGATVKGIRGSDLQKLPVVYPPVNDQRNISDRLRSFDDLIENNCRRIALLEETARLLYREWFVHLRFPGSATVSIENGKPLTWRQATFADVVDSAGGATPSTTRPDYWDGEVVWLTPTDVTRNDCLYLPTSSRKISRAGYDACSATLMPAGTIFMTSRASIGYFALLDQPACTNQGFISVVPKLAHSRNFFLFHLMSRVEEFEGKATGSTFKELSKKAFRDLNLLVPDAEVLKAFEDAVQPAIDQVINLKKQNIRLTEARDALLPKLMSGEIAV